MVDPRKACTLPPAIERPRILVGTYCSADHLLDALARGWPFARMKHLDEA